MSGWRGGRAGARLHPDTSYTYQIRSTSGSLSPSDPSGTQSATTDPAPVNLILSGDSTVGRGETYTLNLGYQVSDGGTSIDYPTSVNIDWGDGTSDALNEADPWYDHTYDTRGVYTIDVRATAPAGTSSAESKVIVGVNPIAMGFNVDLSQSQFDVGGTVEFTASLSGDALDLLHVSKWVVDWDDGSGPHPFDPSSGDPTDQTFTHNYQYGGTTYDVAVTAVTDQGLITGDESVTVKTPADDPNYPSQSQVTVSPTNGGSGSGSNGGSGSGTGSGTSQNFTIDPCAGCVLDYPWCIGWGDGGSDTNYSGGNDTHMYSNSGQYYVTVTNGNGDVIGGTWMRINSGFHPTLSQISDQIVSTGDAVNVTSSASDVYYNEVYEGYIDWGDGTGLYPTSFTDNGSSATLTGHLAAAGDPGQYSASMKLYSVNQPSNHSGLENSANFNVDVAGITINNLRQDQKQNPGATLVTDPGDPTASFEPVTLTVPDSLPVGTIVKLSINDSAMSEAQVLQGPTPNESDAVILGGTADDAADTITWTKGSGTPPWQNLWIEPLAESASLTDIVLSLEVDAPTTQTTPPVTGKSTDHANATAYDPRIMYTPDQANAAAVDITGKTDTNATPILVGQRVSLSISSNLAQNFDWTMEGDTFKDYVVAPDASTGKIVRLAEADMTQRNLTYYYEPTVTGNLLAECTFTINGQSYRREAGFNVYQPGSSFDMLQGRIGLTAALGYPAFGLRAATSLGINFGMFFTATVDFSGLPASLQSQSTFYMTQLINSMNYRIRTTGIPEIKQQDGQWALDEDPDKLGGSHYQNQVQNTVINGQATDTYVDTPLNDLRQQIYNFRFDTFDDYLMFVPSGANSKAVALEQTHYRWYGTAKLRNGIWAVLPNLSGRDPATPTNLVDSSPASQQPTWAQKNLDQNNKYKLWISLD